MCKLAHGSAYVDKMFEKLSAKEAKPGSDRLSDASVPPHGKKVPKGKGDTKLSKDTKQAVMSSVYAAKYAVDGIVKGDYANVFVVQRPPGHHLGDKGRALDANSQGFCYMNGAAIAAEYYLLKHPGARVTIIDCELHPAARPPTHHSTPEPHAPARQSICTTGTARKSACSRTRASSSSTSTAAATSGMARTT